MSRELAQEVLDQLVQNAVQAKREYITALRNREYTNISQRATNYFGASERLAKYTGWTISKVHNHVANQMEDTNAENPS